jgi:glycosyltransferase involved in cell wall biosynthesis
MISVIIPTYKAPASLDICLTSVIQGQSQKNQIIVVVDGTYDINKDVLEKHGDNILVLNLEENVGTCRATNLGVYNSTHDRILIANDDNVFPKNWDELLTVNMLENEVVSPNQIEPYPSMFRQFIIKDLGRTTEDFDIEKFWDYSEMVSSKNTMDDSGSTFPILMFKKDFLRVGGFDESYPSQAGYVADWDFFLKCELSGMKMSRDYSAHFYHFVSVSAKSDEQIQQSRMEEQNCHDYFDYKWGQRAEHNPINNSKMLRKYIVSK